MKQVNKIIHKSLKYQYVFCVEGKAEDDWLTFLKTFIRPKKCFKIENMEGFSTFEGFEGKYKKVLKTWDIKPKQPFP